MRADPSAAPDSLFFDETDARAPVNRFTPISAAERLHGTGGDASSYRTAYLEHLRSVAPDAASEGAPVGWPEEGADGSGRYAPVGWAASGAASAPTNDFFPWQEERADGAAVSEASDAYAAPGAYSAPYPPIQPYPPYAAAYPPLPEADAEAPDPFAAPDLYAAPGAYSAPYPPIQPYPPYAAAYPPLPEADAEAPDPFAAPDLYAAPDFYSAPYPPVQAYPAYAPDAADPQPSRQQPQEAEPELPAQSVAPKRRAARPHSSDAPESKPAQEPEPSPHRARRARSSADISPVRAVLMLALVFATLFACYKLGETALMALGGDEATRALQEEYRGASGGELARDARRVELLPPGETYAPTATPAPTVASVTAPPLISIQEPVVASMSRPTPDAAQQAAALAAGAEATPTPTLVVRAKLRTYPDNPMFNILESLAPLVSENADVVGRFRLEGLIDQLVCQRDNTFYLTHSATGAFSVTGALWLDESVSLCRPPENLLLRGKAASDSDLLAPLLGFGTGGVEFLARNGLMRMDTIYEEASYAVFAVLRTDSNPGSSGYFNYAGYPTFDSDAQFSAYVAAARERSLYDIPVDVRPDDRLLTISALGDGQNSRTLVILARMLRPGESAAALRSQLAAATARQTAP